jgi:hypothetical protein
MTEEQMIEEILMEANAMGFRNELIERVRYVISNGSRKRRIDIYEEEFQKMITELTD